MGFQTRPLRLHPRPRALRLDHRLARLLQAGLRPPQARRLVRTGRVRRRVADRRRLNSTRSRPARGRGVHDPGRGEDGEDVRHSRPDEGLRRPVWFCQRGGETVQNADRAVGERQNTEGDWALAPPGDRSGTGGLGDGTVHEDSRLVV